jgi:lysophospholipase L1-like esterase
MKIQFKDHSYIEVQRSTSPNKIMITIVANDIKKPLETIANSVELTLEQFNQLIQIG